jgi:hypothetical protein
MAIWTLVPIDLNDPNWEASSHRGTVIVRVRNETEARALAARTFDVKTGFRPGQGVRFPPWTRATVVRAEHADDPRFEAEGPAAILEPAFPEVEVEGT